MIHSATSGLLLLCVLCCAAVGCGAATGNPAAAVSDADSEVPASRQDDAPAPNTDSIASEQASDTGAVDGVVQAERRLPTDAGSGKVIEITFDDLICNIQSDIVFRPWMLTDRAKELDGSRIRVAGFMLPFTQQEGIAEFVLLRNMECKFGPGGQADHLIRVKLQDGVTTDYKGDRPLDVVGTLKISPYEGVDGNTWCIYDLEGESVKWKRR